MKKLTLLLVLLISIPFIGRAQEGDPVFFVVEKMPVFPGGQSVADSFIKANIEMPAEAEDVGAEGKVFVQFIIDTTGKMDDINIAKDGVGFGCGEEALRIMQLMAKTYTWQPGEQRNKKVRVRYRYPIIFRQIEEKPQPYQSKGIAPQYPGGRTALDIKFWDEFILPGDIAALGVYGRTDIELFISEEGKLLDAKIIKDGVGFGLAEESLRAIKAVASKTKWIPGKLNGENAAMSYIHIANIIPNRDYYYCAEPDVAPSSMLGDEELKQKILRKTLKRYELSPDESKQLLIIDVMITEAGVIELVHITRNDFDKKLATRVRGAFYPEQSRFIAGTLNGVNVRSRYRMVITRQDITDYMDHIDHKN